MNAGARFRAAFFRGLLRDLRGLVFAVVVYYDYGKFTGIILVQQGGDGLRNRLGFIAGWDDGGNAGPAWRRCVFRFVVVEWAEVPEHAAVNG